MTYAEFFREFPWFAPTLAFLFGTIIGSFLNVCIYRIPAKRSVVTPGSTCACGQPVAWYDNIPVLSWLILRGRARCCGQPFSIRYPLIELFTGLLFLACWLLHPPAVALCGGLFAACLVCAAFIDLDTFEIPDVFTIGLGLVGLILSFAVPALHGQSHEIPLVAHVRSGLVGLNGFLIGSALVLWIAILSELILKKEAMGFGDVKFVGAIGAFCGWQGAVTAIFGGAVIGALWFVVALLWQKISGRRMELKQPDEQETAGLGAGTHVPYGPMLALGGLLHFLILHRWIDAYFARFSELL